MNNQNQSRSTNLDINKVRLQFYEALKALQLLGATANVVFSGNRKKIKQFNKAWFLSDDMKALSRLEKTIKSQEGSEATESNVSDIEQGMLLSERLLINGEALISRLSGQPNKVATLPLKGKKKQRKK